mgnify:CR=1 FL=1
MNEVIFITNGTYEIGFEINKFKEYVIRFRDCNLIGAYGVTFDKRSHFVYKTYTACEGFFIRKQCWKDLLNEHDEFSCQFKDKIKTSYEYTMNKIMEEKQKRL